MIYGKGEEYRDGWRRERNWGRKEGNVEVEEEERNVRKNEKRGGEGKKEREKQYRDGKGRF